MRGQYFKIMYYHQQNKTYHHVTYGIINVTFYHRAKILFYIETPSLSAPDGETMIFFIDSY